MQRANLSGQLLLQDGLESLGIGSELADTLAQLLNGHLVLVEVEAEGGLVGDVGLLLNVQRAGVRSVQLLGDGLGRVQQVLQQVGGDGQVVAASKLGNLASVAERGTHDNGAVAVLLVVVEDGLDGQDTGVLLLGVGLASAGLEPVQNAANEGRDQESASLGGGNGLGKREHEGQVGVDAVVALQDLSGLDTLPGGGNLDQDTVLGDALGLVQVNDVQGLVDGGLGVEGQLGVNLGGDTAGNNVQDLAAELNQQVVEGDLDLLVDGAGGLLADGNGIVNQLGVLGLLGGSQNQRGVGGGILGLVLGDGTEVTRVGDDDL